MYVLDEVDIELLNRTAEGRKYLEYYKKFKGKPYGFGVGMPSIKDYDDSIIKLYDECIKQGKTWEELLGWEYDENIVM